MAFLRKTRDSVCAGDDADAPHACTSEIDPDELETAAFVEDTSCGYLASVAGIGHSWTAILNGIPIARIGVDKIDPYVEKVELADENILHFKYHSATY